MNDKEDTNIREWSGRSNDYPRINRRRRYLFSILIGIVVIYAAFFIQLPYFIFMPGTAEEIKPMVTIAKGSDMEKGALMLTTVRVSDTNIINYLVAVFHPYEQLQPKSAIFRQGESEQEYSQRQSYVMLTSQSSAMQAAYKKAGVPFHIKNEGVMVLQLTPGLPAEKALMVGDILLSIDGKELATSTSLLEYLKGKKLGDSVQLTYRRDKTEKTETLQLAQLPLDAGSKGAPRAGLGILPADMQSVKADQDDKQVSIKAGEIGGPSAGLMFSLEIYNQLVPEDITKGYRIAGTGTIDADGIVGVIGGIEHKIIAADKAGAEIFFAPKDIVPKEGEPILNYTTAVARAKQIHSKMKIVEVETMDDALKYLTALSPKAQ